MGVLRGLHAGGPGRTVASAIIGSADELGAAAGARAAWPSEADDRSDAVRGDGRCGRQPATTREVLLGHLVHPSLPNVDPTSSEWDPVIRNAELLWQPHAPVICG